MYFKGKYRYKEYKKRIRYNFYDSLMLSLFFTFIGVLYLVIHDYPIYPIFYGIMSLLFIFSLLLFFFRRFHWYRYYMTRIIFRNDKVYVEYYDKDVKHVLCEHINDIDIIKGQALVRGKSVILFFKKNKKTIFFQHNVLGWDNIKLEKIYNHYLQLKKQYKNKK